MKFERADDGTLRYRLHQSDLSEFLTCPERARAKWAGEVEDTTSEAAAIGTAVHAAIEGYLKGECHDRNALDVAIAAFDEEASQDGFRWVKIKNTKTVYDHIKACWRSWFDRIYPGLGQPITTEKRFDLPFDRLVHPAGPIEIRLGGTIDYVEEYGIYDWKTTADLRKYTPGFGGEGWKLKRWGIQPTVYTWAAKQLDLAIPDSDGEIHFTFAGIERPSGKVAYLGCPRTRADWEWLRKLCRNVVRLHQADLDEWPLNDQHALCSETWCANWANCKGQRATRVAA